MIYGSGQMFYRSRQVIYGSGPVIHGSGPVIHGSGPVILRVRPGDLRVRPGDLRVRPGDLRVLAGDLRVLAGDLRVRAGDLRVRPGDLRVDQHALQRPMSSRSERSVGASLVMAAARCSEAPTALGVEQLRTTCRAFLSIRPRPQPVTPAVAGSKPVGPRQSKHLNTRPAKTCARPPRPILRPWRRSNEHFARSMRCAMSM
jgi:hypothetical protein